ncbi:MAG TPA: hypothetical protein VEV63_17665 [Streptosporangiaceae bacterium]|nr:hypothetical protein [Streptosporangiaceae bacterium]
MTGAPERNSRRFHFPAPADMPQRADLATSVAVVAFLTQLIFAQLTLALAICLALISKVSRWRPLWLAVPATAGVAWLLAVGIRPATAGYLAAGGRLLSLLARHDTLAVKAKAVGDMLAGWRRWLPGQLPLALIVATAQAAILSLRGPAMAKPPYRSGALVAARSAYLAATLRRGELATYDGCCVGIVPGTGKRAAVSWREAEAGVLCTGQDAAEVSATGRDLVLAAIQHRKTVVVIDLASDEESDATHGRYASRADRIESECAAAGAPLLLFGGGAHHGGRPFRWSAHYDPLSSARPAQATRLAMAMIDWTGVAPARQHFCANYLNAAFTVLASSRADLAGADLRGGAVLDELVRLMAPGALGARFAQMRGRSPAAGSLASRVADLSRQLETDPVTLTPMAAQFAELSAAALSQLLRPAADQASIGIASALAGREVVLFPLDRQVLGGSAAMIARLVVADLINTLDGCGDLGSRADCLVWINGCETIDRRQLAALVALGERTGTAVVLSTVFGSAAAVLAADVNVVAVRGASPAGFAAPRGQSWLAPGSAGPPAPAHDEMADVLARFHAPGCPDALTFAVRRPRRRLLAGCEVVR